MLILFQLLHNHHEYIPSVVLYSIHQASVLVFITDREVDLLLCQQEVEVVWLQRFYGQIQVVSVGNYLLVDVEVVSYQLFQYFFAGCVHEGHVKCIFAQVIAFPRTSSLFEQVRHKDETIEPNSNLQGQFPLLTHQLRINTWIADEHLKNIHLIVLHGQLKQTLT